MNTKNPAIEAVKIHKNGTSNDWVTLSTGYRGRFKPVPAFLIQEAQGKIKDPPIPTQEVEGRTQPVENPLDPDYQAALLAAREERGKVAFDVMLLFGLELEEPVPADGGWLKRLKWLEKRGVIDLSEYDLEDELEREFVFKKYIATGVDDMQLMGEKSGVMQRDINSAREGFRGSKERGPDSQLSLQTSGQVGGDQ